MEKKVTGVLGKRKIKQSQFDYLKKIIKLYYLKKRHMPSNDWLAKTSGLDNDSIIFCLKKLSNFIENLKNPKKVKHIKRKNNNNSIIIKNKWVDGLRYILLFVGCGAIYMSVYYSFAWLTDFLDIPKALLLALIMVMFAVVAFELIILFKQRMKYVLVVVFSILWSIVTFFSMISTVAGQYNARMNHLTKTYTQENKQLQSNRKYEEYKEQKEEYRDALKNRRNELVRYETLLLQYDSLEKIEENKKNYNRVQWRLYSVKKDIKNILRKLKKLRKKRPVTVIKKNPPDFYVWLSRLFDISPELIQFWLSVFPAIFIDLIAPLSFAVVIFIKK